MQKQSYWVGKKENLSLGFMIGKIGEGQEIEEEDGSDDLLSHVTQSKPLPAGVFRCVLSDSKKPTFYFCKKSQMSQSSVASISITSKVGKDEIKIDGIKQEKST